MPPKTPWEAEHGFDYEVPGFVDFLVSKGVFKDESWHNDSCPCFRVPSRRKQGGEPYGLTLWVEHPLSYSRDSGNTRFFAVEGQFISENDAELATEDLYEALLWIFRRIGGYLPKYAGGNPEETIQELSQEWVLTERKKRYGY